MNKTSLTIIGIIISFILFVLWINGLSNINIIEGNAVGGQIFIDEIHHDKAISLDGEWEIYWNKIIYPYQFQNLEPYDVDFFHVPSLWQGKTLNQTTLSEIGVATYRLFLDINMSEFDDGTFLALRMPFVYAAHQLWLNGEKIASNGMVACSKSEEELTRQPLVVLIKPRNDRNELVLHISNHHLYRGGLNKSIFFGRADYLIRNRENQITKDIFMMGSFFITGIFFLLLYLNRQSEKAILYFSFICFIFLIRSLLVNEIIINDLVGNFDWRIGNRIEAGFSYIGVPIIFLFFGELYKSYFNAKFLNFWRIFAIIGFIIIALSPHRFYDHMLLYVNILQTIYVVYLFYLMFRNYNKASSDFYALLTGKVVLVVLALHDIIVTYANIDTSLKLHVGMYIFVFCLGYALTLYLYREFSKVESLVEDNEKMFDELCKMNHQLEELVEERTKELEDTNKKLFQLSMLDGLTGIPNRMQFNEKLDKFLMKATESSVCFSILFLDIDYFKNYNDNYGHINGDTVLKRIASTLHKKVDNGFIARYGGEEFVVLYLNKNIEETYKLAEELRVMIMDLKIPHLYSPISSYVTISIGGVSVIPTIECTSTSILDKADKALYKAKGEGRNRSYMITDED